MDRHAGTLRALALCAWAGLTAGLELAVLETLWNGYPALGFWRNAVVTARSLAATGAAAGFGGGFALVVLMKTAGPLAARVVRGSASLGIGALVAVLLMSGWLVTVGVDPGFVLPAAGGTAAALLLLLVILAGLASIGFPPVPTLLASGLLLLGLKIAALRFVYLRYIQSGDRTGLPEVAVLAAGTVVLIGLAAFVGVRSAGARRGSLTILTVAIAIPVSLWLAAAGPPRGDGSSDDRLNVLMIGIDTLRLDRTSGGEDLPGARPIAPRLAALSRDGVVFTHAITQAPWTMPAFASIMTGLYPFEHGADSLLGTLPRSRVTLAEVLTESGYATAAVVSHYYLAGRVGLAQGFETVDESNVTGAQGESSAGVTDDALAFVDSAGRRPFFLFAHYFDPHYEYENRDAIDAADGYRGWLDGVQDMMALRLMRHMMSPADIEQIRDLYDEEVAHTDAQIGRLLDGLRDRGLYERTAIVVVADHGEELMERGWLGHSITLHDEVVRVPLILILPGADLPPIHHGTVETRSIFATVLDHLGIERRGEGPGLRDALEGKGPAGAFSAVWMPDAHVQSGKRVRMASYQTDDWKLILDVDRGGELLYDVRSDPLERSDLSDAEPEILASMRTSLRAWLERMLVIGEAGQARTPSEEEREMLRSLGYL